MDLIIANDQHLYLRASDYKERQKWLVAFATQKATFPTTNLAHATSQQQQQQPMTPSLQQNAQFANHLLSATDQDASNSTRNSVSTLVNSLEMISNYQNLSKLLLRLGNVKFYIRIL